eukprot:3679976-Amphidinium_carterae.1
MCLRILDLRGLGKVPELTDEQREIVEIVMMNSFTESRKKCMDDFLAWAREQDKAVVWIHDEVGGPGQEGYKPRVGEYDLAEKEKGLAKCMESHVIGALQVSSNWVPLLEKLKGDPAELRVLHSTGSTESENWYVKLESLVEALAWIPSIRPKFRQQKVFSQLYGAYARQGSGVTRRSWQHSELLQLIHQAARTYKLGEYTSVVVNRLPEGRPLLVHRDKANLPGTNTWVTSFGPFKGRGGRLWTFSVEG